MNDNLPNLPTLAPEGCTCDGPAGLCKVRAGADVDLHRADANVSAACSGDCGCDCGSGKVVCEGEVK
jgi:hypothetical protein